MKKNVKEKILFSKGDIASMLGVSRGILRVACETLRVEGIDWRSKTQRFTDQEVFNIIKALRKRLTDEEIDLLIRQNARF